MLGRKSPLERFLASFEIGSSCWLWTGALNVYGYGKFFEIIDGRRRHLAAHRKAYELWVGPIPDGLSLDHLCHNADKDCVGGEQCPHRRCINPAHLEPISIAENIRRAARLSQQRGRNLVEMQRAKTHCPHGHPYDVTNTLVVSTTGERQCRACNTIRRQRAIKDGYFRRYYREHKYKWQHTD